MATEIWGTVRLVMMDIGFGCVTSVIKLKDRLWYSNRFIKKKVNCTTYTKSKEVVKIRQVEDVGTKEVRKVT